MEELSCRVRTLPYVAVQVEESNTASNVLSTKYLLWDVSKYISNSRLVASAGCWAGSILYVIAWFCTSSRSCWSCAAVLYICRSNTTPDVIIGTNAPMMAIMAMTTTSSMSVKADRWPFIVQLGTYHTKSAATRKAPG